MYLPQPDLPADSPHQRAADRRRWLRAFNLSLAFVFALVVVFSAQGTFDARLWAVHPHEFANWRGLLGAPLLHGSFEHLAANAIALLTLGTLAGGLYPRALVRAIPLAWLGSGLGAWLLGDAGSFHLGASGVTHGLMFLLLGLGLLRRDRPAVAAAMIAFMFYGGMLLTVLPREAGVSWQSHLGGAVAGLVAAWLWRSRDPALPRKRYSWELEEEAEAATAQSERDEFELPRPHDVPVLWRREAARGEVVPFVRRTGADERPD
jgi:membrane associated rhomboid family serine protease